MVQSRGAGPVKGGAARRVRKHVPKPRKMPTSELDVPGGRISGVLTGSYTFEDGTLAVSSKRKLSSKEQVVSTGEATHSKTVR